MNKIKKCIYMALFFLMSGCDFYPYTTIVDGYYYVESTAYSRYIEKDSKRLIKDIVIQYSFDQKNIYALRQVVNHFLCNSKDSQQRHTASQVQDVLEYWAIDLRSGKVVGPMSEGQFKLFVTSTTGENKMPLATIQEASDKNLKRLTKNLVDCKDAELLY